MPQAGSPAGIIASSKSDYVFLGEIDIDCLLPIEKSKFLTDRDVTKRGRKVNLLPIVDHLGSIASLLSLPAGLIFFVAWLRSAGVARTLTLVVALPIAIAAYTIDISDRLGWIKLSETGDLVQSWGRHDGSFFMLINSRLLHDYKDNFKMMLIFNVPYANIDRMPDTAIEKSAMFTITGQPTNIAVPLPSPHHLRVAPQPNSKIGDAFDVLMNYNLVVVPNNSSAEQIRSLSDVERVGGRILTTVATYAQFTTIETGGQKQGG